MTAAVVRAPQNRRACAIIVVTFVSMCVSLALACFLVWRPLPPRLRASTHPPPPSKLDGAWQSPRVGDSEWGEGVPSDAVAGSMAEEAGGGGGGADRSELADGAGVSVSRSELAGGEGVSALGDGDNGEGNSASGSEGIGASSGGDGVGDSRLLAGSTDPSVPIAAHPPLPAW